MALTASLPVIEDLAMKFNRHSLQDSFQLPSFYQYPHWQAKEFTALYFQPNHGFLVEPSLAGGVAPFEFKASGNFTTKRSNRYKIQNDRTTTTRHSPQRSGTTKEQVKSNKPQTLNPASNCSDNKEPARKSIAVKALDFDSEDSLSEDEELSCYFSQQSEHFNDRFAQKPSPNIEQTSPTRSHNRKRSMEDEECTTIKRCCRPRLNFDKMLLTSRDARESRASNEKDAAANYFRPISPQDSLP